MNAIQENVLDRLKIEPPAAERSEQLGQEDFLALMVAQLRNQDPFKPMENGDFLAQMAQFSTVSGIQEMQSAITQLAESLYSNQVLQASSLVGKTVEAPLGRAALGDEGAVSGSLDLSSSAGNAVVNIKDASGALVKRLPLGSVSAGTAEFVWDGTDSNGARAAPGVYDVHAEASFDGEPVALPVLLNARVASVSLDAVTSAPVLELDNGHSLSLGDVRRIK